MGKGIHGHGETVLQNMDACVLTADGVIKFVDICL